MGKSVFIKNVGRVFFPDEMADDAIAAAMPKVNQLATDHASRMARAKEQGFDTSQTYYHGTQKGGFDELNRSKSGELGGGVYITNNKDVASDFFNNQWK